MLPSLPSFAHLPGLLIVVALLLIMVIAPILSALAARRAIPDGRAKHMAYARTILVLWSMTGLAFYALRLHRQSLTDIGFVAPSHPLLAYGFALALVAGLALGNARAVRGRRFADYHERVRRVIPLTRGDWVWYVPVALTAGMCEEILYRGYALNVIASLSGSLALGVVLSTIAFGLAHAYQGWRGVIATGFLGGLFALIYVAFGSLYPCMLAHVLQDLIGGATLSRRLTRSDAAAPSLSPGEAT